MPTNARKVHYTLTNDQIDNGMSIIPPVYLRRRWEKAGLIAKIKRISYTKVSEYPSTHHIHVLGTMKLLKTDFFNTVSFM